MKPLLCPLLFSVRQILCVFALLTPERTKVREDLRG